MPTRIFFSILLILTLHGCAGSRGHVKTVTPENSLQSICQKYGIEWQWDSISQVFTFNNKGVTSKVLIGSNLVIVGDKRVILSEPVVRRDNMIVVPPDFIDKVLGSRLEKPVEIPQVAALTGKCREIMIDAGHGGKDPGARGVAGTVEKDIVFDIANRLRMGLERVGFKVTMTRDTDDFISLQRRTELATGSRADLFVSIHANASKSRKIKGLEIYYSRKLDHESDLTQRDINQRFMLDHLKIAGNSPVPGRIIKDMMYSNKLAESAVVADLMIQNTSRSISTPNRGSRPCGFFVVKNTLIPAILFEVGYLTNSTEAKLLKTEDYRQKIADAITESIVEYSNES